MQHPMRNRYEVEREEKWREWVGKIPALRFPADWDVQIIPPFGGALARFCVNNHVSVYFDGFHALGSFGTPGESPVPYWEMYPSLDGDVERFAMADTAGLLAAIQAVLEQVRP